MVTEPRPSFVALRSGQRDERGLLSDLALRSKAYWGYGDDFLAACRDELTLTAGLAEQTVVALVGGEVVGFCLLEDDPGLDPGTGRLGMLFVDPVAIGSGVGRVLWADALHRARSRGWRAVVLDADPGAEGFYLRLGARRVGEAPSGSVPGRVLPVLEVVLDRAGEDAVADGHQPTA